MSKFKITEFRDGFKVWELTDHGIGFGWEDVGRFFRSREEAERYIEKRKRGEEDDSSGEGNNHAEEA